MTDLLDTGRIRIGVSGWRYEPWRGHFYPQGLAQSRELAWAAAHFNSLEINGSFYSLQRPAYYAQWAAQVPDGFVFAVKGSRYITHMLRLRGVEIALANFFSSGLLALGDRLGPILWQFPPNLAFDAELFEGFFHLLPRSTGEAAQLAHLHDRRTDGRDLLEPVLDMPLRHAVEVRHDSFVDPAFVRLLRRHRVGWVVADTPEPWPLYEDLTADFVYMRLHGSTELYNSRYTRDELARWAAHMLAWAAGGQPRDARLITPEPPPACAGRDVFCYFDNTDKRHAPDNARELMALCGVDWLQGQRPPLGRRAAAA
jgi:uncharacterized protein YecE (DUF72 family)